MEKEKKFIITESQIEEINVYLKNHSIHPFRQLLKQLPILKESEGGKSDVSK